ncbi:MAG TPA: hypothetical protein PK691_03560, partial [Thermomicrobiales bacterium]|nr:hypothetical protein [Thermomicrobiales bacterium]
MAIGMVLAALFLAALAMTIKRHGAQRPGPAEVLVGVGFAVFGLAIIIPKPISSDLGMVLTAIAASAFIAACLLAWLGNIRTPWTVDDTL